MHARRRGSAGFTLIEVLVAAGLVSVVLGLALKGFTEAKKIADITKAKVIAEEEASLGAQKLSKILKKTHIIYFDARPLARATADVPTLGGLAGIRTAAPPGWLSGAISPIVSAGQTLGVPNVNLGTTTSNSYREPLRTGWGGLGFSRSLFFVRHLDDGTASSKDTPITNPNLRLKSGERTAGGAELADDFDRFFTSPLLYCAEATFDNAAPTGGARVEANLPVTWTFYLVYLAPMRFDKATDDGHALFPVQEAAVPGSLNNRRDKGPEGWTRATVPYELRLLTIPDVRAINIATAETAPNPTAMPLPSRVGYHLGRRLDSVSVLPFPFDVVQNEANYDPIPTPMGAATFLQMTTASTHFGAACGPRVKTAANDAVHGNWDNLGNDPPTQAALQNRAHWDSTTRSFLTAGASITPITDTLLARYVDPDAVHGTFVRLANDQNLRNELEAKPRPYMNAYGGPQRYNPQWWNAANPTVSQVPTRALVSVATRFRFSRQHPFAFSTESIEVDLETLTRFQNMDHRKRR